MADNSEITTNPTWSSERKIGLLFVFGPMLLVLIIEVFARVTLVSSLPVWVYSVAIIAGAYYAHVFLQKQRSINSDAAEMKFSQKIAFYALYALGIAPYLVRQLILFLAFLTVHVEPVNLNYVIDGTLGRKGPERVELVPKDFEGRSISVFASSDLTDMYFHISTHGKDCIALLTETGVGGLKRAKTPSFFDYFFNSDAVLGPAAIKTSCPRT